MRWPDSVTANLWPYAVRMANDAINNTPCMQDKQRRSPIEIFASKVVSNPKHWKPFGCPVYVLDNNLQGRQPFHKWSRRSRVGVYVGKSPHHARNVALVLDRATGLVSPQFHVSFDPMFETVKYITTKSMWQNKAGFVGQRETGNTNRSETNTTGRSSSSVRLSESRGTTTPKPTTTTPEGGKHKSRKRRRETSSETSNGKAVSPESPANKQGEPAAAIGGGDPPTPTDNGNIIDDEVTGRLENKRRSGRKAKPSSQLNRLITAMTTEIKESTSSDVEGEIMCYEAMFPDDDKFEYDDPLFAFKAVSDPDTLYFHQAMKEKDSKEFLKSMTKEVDDQFENGNFTIIPRSEVLEGNVILPAVWQMRRKRDARTGAIKKYKARLNIDGSRTRHGIHYNETYSPVASWNSVRMLLTLTAVHGWHTKQIDFVQAFAQAPVERTLYMRIPAGIEIEDGSDPRDYVLKIHRNIYGQKQAGRVWNKFLVNKLVNELGFKQSKVDECVFYRGKTLYVLYTDDSLLAGPDKNEIDTVIDELKSKANLEITVEGDLADLLGVSIDRRPDGTIHLTQSHLIDQILEDLRLNDDKVKPRSTPAASSRVLLCQCILLQSI